MLFIEVNAALLHVLEEFRTAVVAAIEAFSFIVGPGAEAHLFAGQPARRPRPTAPHQYALMDQTMFPTLGARVRFHRPTSFRFSILIIAESSLWRKRHGQAQ
jgi:hypothetical protein